MSTSMFITIAMFAVAAILILVALIWAFLGSRRPQHDRVEADKIRDSAKQELLHARQREALADETAAKARAAQAAADIKAAQASRLEQQAAAHRSEAATSRGRLNEQWDRAGAIDPPTPTPETAIPPTASGPAHRK